MKKLLIALLIPMILLGNGREENDTYLYDVSMLPQEEPLIVACPEIKIRFSETVGSFKPGDKLYLKLKTISEDDQSLFWYYPPIHDRNISLAKKLVRKIQHVSLNPRIKRFTICGKAIPYPTLRTMSDDILGNARSKVGSKISFLNDNTELQINIEDKIGFDDFLRLRGLYLGAKALDEIGPNVIEYGKNKKNWQILGTYEFVIGKSFISNVTPKRFIRMIDKQYQLSLDIETGRYPTIEENGKLIVKLSDNLQANWGSVDEQTVIVKDGKREHTYSVVPEVSDRSVILPITFEIPPESHLILPNMVINSTTSPIDQLSSGSISIHTELTGNFDYKSARKETRLGEKSEPILFMYPSVIVEGQDLMFYTKSDTEPAVNIRINTEQDSYLESGDKVKIVIPQDVILRWGNRIPSLGKQGIKIRKTSHNTIELNFTKKIEEPIVLENMPFEVPSGSIPPFQLACYFSFAPDTLSLPIKGEISFGQSSVAMEKPKLINRLQGDAVLNDIIVTEDELVTTLKSGDVIEIIGNEDYFSFNTVKLTDIEIVSTGRFDRNPKIAVQYQQCTDDKIVLIVRTDLNKGESIAIKNIPVSYIQQTGSDIFLKYNINDKCLLRDENEIRIIDLSLEIAAENEFVRDINNLSRTFTLSDISVDIGGEGKLFDPGKNLELSLPEESAEWANLNAVDIFPSEMFSIREKSKRSILLSPTSEVYNEATIYIKNLSVRPIVDEFIDKKLKLTTVMDTTVFAISNNSITYSYPSLTSLDDQVFFTDDTTWKMYNIDINTRSLDNTILPGSKISILLSSDRVNWDTKYDVIQIKGEHAERLGTTVEFEGKACHIVVNDTVRANMFFEVSGLRIIPIEIYDIEFSLKLSLDGCETICALDFDSKRFKYVRPSIDYTEKISRSINESAFAMKSNRTWCIKIPDSIEYEWESTENIIEPVPDDVRKGMNKGSVNFRSISENVKFIDKKTAVISIINGYGTLKIQPLQISGLSKKKLFFKGLRLVPLSENEPDESNSYLEFIVETPYGNHAIRSDKSVKSDWGLTIDGRKSFYPGQLVGREMEIGISMPQVVSERGVVGDKKLVLYSKENVLLFEPLVKRFKIDYQQKAKKEVLTSAEYIKKFYDDTYPKGANWKVWYYLAWAKWRADDLDILNQLKNTKWLRNDGVLTRENYDGDMAKAKRKGYQPEGRHKAYPTLQKGDLLAEINNRIGIAEVKFRKGDMVDAEQDFLKILSDTKKNDEVRHLSAVVNYWLGRIALDLGDIEYDNYRASYPYGKFANARKIFKSNKSLFSGELWLEDSIKVYRNHAKELVKSHRNVESTSIPRQPGLEGEKVFSMSNTFRFTYSYDNSYTYNIIGESGSAIGLVHTEENTESFLAKGRKLSLMFEDEIRLSRGGDYSVMFSPKQQSLFNILTYAMLIGLIGFIYG